MTVDFPLIEQRKQHLDYVKAELKAYFIGIDSIIDDLMDYIQVWYLLPDVLNRPVIVNLWGMTGVGKTDLIRQLVRLLDYQDRFVEIELSNIDGTNWSNSVSQIFGRNGINDGKPAIVLFDEIQRFNTLDTEGKPLPQTKFMDFWELLSDGKLSKREKDDLDYYITSMMFSQKDIQKRKKKGEENLDENPLMDFWQANELRRMMNLDMSMDEMTDMSQQDMVKLMLKEKSKKKIYEPISHAKSLIIISGNLDDAFTMANQTSETDVDADIFQAFTRKVTVVDIKNSLSRKFRPEQVARFGNIHLIYTSLRRADFELLIAREIERVVHITAEKFGISLQVSGAIAALIYRNGVFPVQGVRPVFSSVIDILESNLSKFVFQALTNGQTTIAIDYDLEHREIRAQIGADKLRVPYVGRIDKIRNSNLEDTVANISVHEAGHAVVYMLLTGLAPLQLKSKLASSYAGGFTFPHQIHETRETLVNKIKIYLAGGLAEEVVFGREHASIGRINDRVEVTQMAVDYVRRYGFDEEFQANYTLEFGYVMDKAVTDADIEKMITRLVGQTNELLLMNRTLLHELSLELAAHGSLEAPAVAAIATRHGVNVSVREEGFLAIYGYDKALRGTNKTHPDNPVGIQ
ncbi:AAA family ATPase [Fibrella aquatilis]|uniref:AAA family ATPase n=1 Tax=Fibrella aquatilis TaxID=2817059 RepID=A0A939K210_9BACT|nr:AAA family ATPase [Fibrella aquatilis]MBO0932815.1 AAA family ATPase [Fibrella aquatilis]